MLWNIKKANEELEAVDAILQPALAKAKVTHAMRKDGQSVSIAEASRSERLTALFAASPVGEGQQQAADLLVSNAHLAERLEKSESDLQVATATVGGLQFEKRNLTTRAETAEASVQNLTNEKAQKQVELDAAIKENARITGNLNAVNTELSRMCLQAGCLSLTKDGQPLPATASDAEKLAVAEAIPAAEKLTAYKGAVHLVLSRLGVNTISVPNGGPTASRANLSEHNLLAKLDAIKDPAERAAFVKKHRSELFALANKK